MRNVIGWMAALVVAVGLAGCTAGPGAGTPCEKCEYGYYATGKSLTRKVGCIVDGKAVDCAKNPSDCPACKK